MALFLYLLNYFSNDIMDIADITSFYFCNWSYSNEKNEWNICNLHAAAYTNF